MYCPVCGADNLQSVKFCKRCGASVSMQPPARRAEITAGKLTGMFWAIAILTLGGLGVILGCAIPLLALGLHYVALGVMSLVGFLTVFGIAGLLIRQLSRLISIVEANPQQLAAPGATAEYAPPQITGQPRPVVSVTENTTRNFEPVLNRERVTRE